MGSRSARSTRSSAGDQDEGDVPHRQSSKVPAQATESILNPAGGGPHIQCSARRTPGGLLMEGKRGLFRATAPRWVEYDELRDSLTGSDRTWADRAAKGPSGDIINPPKTGCRQGPTAPQATTGLSAALTPQRGPRRTSSEEQEFGAVVVNALTKSPHSFFSPPLSTATSRSHPTRSTNTT